MAKSNIVGPGVPKTFLERTELLAAQKKQATQSKGTIVNRTVIVPSAPAPARPVPPVTIPNAGANQLGVTEMTVDNPTGIPIAVDDSDPRVQVFGASGTDHAAGIVPDPGATAGTTKFLREDATWGVPAGGSLPSASQIGQVLFSTNGSTFDAQLPVTTLENGWIINDEGILIVSG